VIVDSLRCQTALNVHDPAQGTGHRAPGTGSQLDRGFDAEPAGRPDGGRVAAAPSRGPECHEPRTRRRTTSASFATFARWIRASWWPGGIPVPSINRRTRINHNNRRVPVAGVTSVTSGDDCGEQGQTGAVTRSSSSLWSADERAGWRHSWQSSLSGTRVPPATSGDLCGCHARPRSGTVRAAGHDEARTRPRRAPSGLGLRAAPQCGPPLPAPGGCERAEVGGSRSRDLRCG
jgi:hypothetical protein